MNPTLTLFKRQESLLRALSRGFRSLYDLNIQAKDNIHVKHLQRKKNSSQAAFHEGLFKTENGETRNSVRMGMAS